ncbi:MAG: ATP-dependent helicase/nuclease subunit B [Motiliproteus sp.]|jgi:ATP-dependent helicase/nuclease subunit B
MLSTEYTSNTRIAALFSTTSPHQTLQQALLRQQTILTPNRRLSRHILDRYGLQQRQQGIQAWHTPAVFSLEGWGRQLWQQLQDSNHPLGRALLLDSRQELQLWKQCLMQDPDTQHWLQPAGAARHAQQALKTLQLWRQHPQSEQLQPFVADELVFERWHDSFRERCHELQAITFCDAIERLISAFEQGALAPEAQVWLVEFQDIAPLYQRLLEVAFKEQHTLHQAPHQTPQGIQPPDHCQRLACDTTEHEIQRAGQWARQILHSVPGASIAIVDPQLSARRSLHERIYRQILEPAPLFADTAVDAPLFNMSIGTPLADCPAIDTALMLLSLINRPLLLDELPALLYNPFLAGLEPELEQRIELEQRLRRLGLAELSLTLILQQLARLRSANHRAQGQQQVSEQLSLSIKNSEQLSEQEPKQLSEQLSIPESEQPCCPILEQALQLLHRARHLPKRTLNEWSPWIYSILTRMGWPGQRSASSLEYQQLKHWYELLAGLTRFDLLLEPLSFSDALKLLRTESQSTIFQPQTPDSALQILGPLEAAGLRFTHLWVMGLNDESWPTPPDLNPLLPAAYQQLMQMPHASAERELSFARQLTQLFAASATQVVFSHPQRIDDQHLRPSALICGYPAVTPDELQLSPKHRFCEQQQAPHPAQLQTGAPRELIDTAQAPGIDARELALLRGGSSILTNQALCPFSAFAVHRLGAKPLERSQTGLSQADRGNLIHAVMEHIWQQLHSQKQLLAAEPQALQQLIDTAITKAITPFLKRVPSWMGSRFWGLEQQRLQALVERWLALERERPEFRVVGVEKALNTEFGGMPLRLRIDRVDRLNDGTEMLIDYKSGTPQVADWFSDRPRQPQLPLYSLVTRHPVSALAFGQLNAREVTFKGVSAQDIPALGITPLAQVRNAACADWEQMLGLWQHSLGALMSEFIAGEVRVDPLDPNAYQYSQLQPFNRYYELERLGSNPEQEIEEVPSHD